MSAIETASPHIRFDARGRAWLTDANVKVLEIAAEHLAYGWSAEMIHEHHPQLPPAKIYAALAYFYDHEDAMLGQLCKQDKVIEEIRRKTEKATLRKRLQLLKRRMA